MTIVVTNDYFLLILACSILFPIVSCDEGGAYFTKFNHSNGIYYGYSGLVKLSVDNWRIAVFLNIDQHFLWLKI